MSALTDVFENRVYDWLFRPGQAVTRPTTIFCGLFTAAGTPESGTVTEVTGGSYARVDVTSAFGAPTNGAGSNTAAVTFAAPTANWGTVTHFGIFDASTGGNLIAYGTLSASRVISNGDAAPSFAAGALTPSVQ